MTPLQLDDGRILLVSRGFVPLEPADRRRRPPATSSSPAGCSRSQRAHARAASATRSTGDLAEAQRVDIDRLAPQLPGEVVPMYVELTSSDPPEADAVPGAADAARADRRAAPVLRRAVVHLRRRRRRRLGARGAQVDQDAPGRGTTSSRRRSPRGSRRNSVVIVRLTSPRRRVDAQVRRPDVDRQLEERVEERRQLVLVEARAAPRSP